MKALFQYLKAIAPSSPWRESQVLEGDNLSSGHREFAMTSVLNKTNKKPLRLLTFNGTLATVLFALPQVLLLGNLSGSKVLAQQSGGCPVGTTSQTLQWTATNNLDEFLTQNLSVGGIRTTFSFTESLPGQVLDRQETRVGSTVYGGLQPPNLEWNIGLQKNPAPGNSFSTLTITFAQPITLASPLTFLDVDKSGQRDTRNGVEFLYQDRITVTAVNGNTPVGVTLRAISPNNVRVTGNVAEGINENALREQNFGNVEATLAGPLTQIQVIYQSGTEFGQPLQDETIGLARINICVPTGIGTIGDSVFNDANGNNVQDQGETGIPNVILNLIGPGADGQFGTADDVTIQTTTTNNNGNYRFTNVPPGTYRVTIPNPPAGFTPTLTQPNPITVAANQNIDTVDFGFRGAGSIGDTVFNDANANNRQDSGETGIPNVTVILRDTNGNQIATTTTAANGTYRFSNLPPGNYTVAVPNSPSGFNPTLIPQSVNLQANQNFVDADFGFTQQPVGSIGNTVFNDRNGNNVQDAGEAGIPNVTLTLIGAGPDGQFGTPDDITRTTTTDNNGTYRFTNLPPGTYRVTITNPPANFTPTLTQPNPITVAAGQNINTANFGFNVPALGAAGTNLLFVKRITNVLRNGQPIPGANFTTFDDGPGNDDNQINQSQPVRGVRDLQTPVQSGDEVEYTIYFLAQGVNNVRFCDLIPDGTSYGNNGISVSGAGNGADQGRFFSPLAPLPAGNTCQSQTNNKGAVIVNLGTFSTNSGNPAFVRFRVKVD